jgi:aminomuconate-semialdehyde/2-hydroxymuconate-6-semialdehyde dehydrogenase
LFGNKRWPPRRAEATLSAIARVAGVPVSLDHYIGGERVPPAGGSRFTDLCPIDEQPLGEVARGGAAEARDAVTAAAAAFGAWGQAAPAERAAALAGVAVLITPWNAPLMLATWKVAPALAAGATVVLKPAEQAPLTASLLADAARDAGLPAGVLNVVQGTGEEAGAALVADPRVARISFTGSVPTARSIAAAAAPALTPASFELGGKSPLLVFADADLDLAADLAAGQYDNAGQVCLAGTRLLVQDSVAAQFTAGLLDRARALRQGDPRDPATDIGPQITREHLARVDGFVRRAREQGAQVLLGGGPNEDLGGLYYRPTLIGGAAPGAEILTREVFGPVLTLQAFASEDEAVELANGTEYGLAAVVVTGDRERADRVSARLVAGTVWVNCFFVRDLRAPFGGARHSGIGREGGDWSFDFYCDVKNTVTAPAGWRRG